MLERNFTDPYDDYLSKKSEAKKERTAKNQLQNLKNEMRAKKTGAQALPTPGIALTNMKKSAQQVTLFICK